MTYKNYPIYIYLRNSKTKKQIDIRYEDVKNLREIQYRYDIK